MEEDYERKILCVGLVCADIISVCDHYPKEDTDHRCLEQRWHRGGNASNNCTVLSLLGAQCEFMGTLAKSTQLNFFERDFKSYGIAISHCVYHDDCDVPLSVCIINQQNGSRTIIHSNKNLPELTFDDFKNSIKLNEKTYTWIHFEGRPNVEELKKIVQFIDEHNRGLPLSERITTSVELEKNSTELAELFDMFDYIYLSKEFAKGRGYISKEEAVQALAKKNEKRATLICPWGEAGVIARTPNGTTCSSPIFSPPKVIDTLGAGDTFLASSILALSRGKSLQQAIEFGCQIAGAKCGMNGFNGIRELDYTL